MTQLHDRFIILKAFDILILISAPKFIFRNLNIIVEFNPNWLVIFRPAVSNTEISLWASLQMAYPSVVVYPSSFSGSCREKPGRKSHLPTSVFLHKEKPSPAESLIWLFLEVVSIQVPCKLSWRTSCCSSHAHLPWHKSPSLAPGVLHQAKVRTVAEFCFYSTPAHRANSMKAMSTQSPPLPSPPYFDRILGIV